MKAAQLLHALSSTDPDLNQEVIINANGIDYTVVGVSIRHGGIRNGSVMLDIRALPDEAIKIVRMDESLGCSCNSIT